MICFYVFSLSQFQALPIILPGLRLRPFYLVVSVLRANSLLLFKVHLTIGTHGYKLKKTCCSFSYTSVFLVCSCRYCFKFLSIIALSPLNAPYALLSSRLSLLMLPIGRPLKRLLSI